MLTIMYLISQANPRAASVLWSSENIMWMLSIIVAGLILDIAIVVFVVDYKLPELKFSEGFVPDVNDVTFIPRSLLEEKINHR